MVDDDGRQSQFSIQQGLRMSLVGNSSECQCLRIAMVENG